MTTQATFLADARIRLDEASADQWTDAQIRSWINEGAMDIARKTESLQDRQTIAGVVGTAEYSLATNCIRVHRVEWTPTGENTTRLEYADVKSMDGYGWEQRTLQNARPYAYTIWGSGTALKLVTFPAPSTAGNFTTWYYRLPTNLAEDGTAAASTVEIPQGWDEILLDYVEYRALRKDRDPRWQENKALYDENLLTMYENTRRWTDSAGVIDHTYSSLPAWLTSFAE